MKKNLLYLLLAVATLSVTLTACNDDNMTSESVVRQTTTEENDFDQWIMRNFTTPYNIEIYYRLEDIQTELSYYITPANINHSIRLSKLILHGVLRAYDNVTGSTNFIRANFPKIILYCGSFSYQSNGSARQGEAEGGVKITFFGLDGMETEIISPSFRYFKTCHHEFTHILNQTIPYATDFKEITPKDYIGDDWNDSTNGYSSSQALQKGFISTYAAKSYDEDFAELVSLYVTNDAAWWESQLSSAGTDGRALIEEKFTIVRNYMSNSWGIDLDELREMATQCVEEAVAKDNTSLVDDLFGY